MGVGGALLSALFTEIKRVGWRFRAVYETIGLEEQAGKLSRLRKLPCVSLREACAVGTSVVCQLLAVGGFLAEIFPDVPRTNCGLCGNYKRRHIKNSESCACNHVHQACEKSNCRTIKNAFLLTS